ncbi:protein EI24 homolog isoform X2 [Selaginella moellendorffii]|uniref:protein EI24 homolog isoform X2 n=1 Tax=Selaginella moellendorffii TaxID=88036 RepID=UPI000D1CBE10|nr:protein EI24 homolog isoform X2 [Selaginella moellendorffii]|eukprot:XP_024526006.1 protein EI24 homolog isoform X2 [Selaginella moellendorffii]
MAPSRGERASAAPTSPWIALLMLWLAGCMDACRFDRAFLICRRSGVVRKKTGQCFLNGLLVLGSVLVLQKAIIPALSWLLDFEAHVDDGSARPVPKLQSFLIALYYVLWLYPIYVISFVINCIHSNEIAQHVFHEVKKTMNEPTSRPSTGTSSTAAAFDSFTRGIGENLYSVIVIGAFFAEAFVASFIPYVGQLLYFVLLSWLYAYYCFEYKWGLAQWSLERRLVFFETNWAFFSGFGSPCVLATFFFSPLVSTGVTAILYPLFVLIATASDPEKSIARVKRDSSLFPRLPIFYLANSCSLPIVRFFVSRFPATR